jgi:PAS domain S-box-containing protein
MGLFGVSKDITDRKRAEEALRESEETTKALLNAPSDTSMLIDTKGTILAINKTGAQRLGKGVNGLVGLSINQYLPEGLARKRLEEGEKVLRSGRPVHFEDEREGRYFENSIYPTFGKEGNVSRLAVFARDITYRKQKEEERENLICKLQDALDDVKTLSGMLPICASCNKIRDDKGYWNQIESYIRDHSEAVFSHSICPECAKILYPELTIHE